MGTIMNAKKLSFLLILAASVSSTAWSACRPPESPRKAPDGKTATKDQLLNAKKLFEQFDTNIVEYRNCIKADYDDQLKKNPKGDEKLREEFHQAYKTKDDRAYDEVERAKEDINRQLAAYQCFQLGKTDKCASK